MQRRLRTTMASILISGLSLSLSANALDLPPLLNDASGRPVTTRQHWEQSRRPELLKLFESQIFGRAPVGRPANMHFAVVASNPQALNGAATWKRVHISLPAPSGAGSATIDLSLYIPNNRAKPAATMLLINHRDVQSMEPALGKTDDFWPVQSLIDRGYATASFSTDGIALDDKQELGGGVFDLYDPATRAPDAWGRIAAWSWGASRVMDYLVTDKDIDKHRVAVVGHSRGGKAALWAGATDTRFAMVVSNESGSTGAAIAREKQGESIADINGEFLYWFADNYKQYNDNENALPVDQHMLIALMAPRLVYVASAVEDTWSDPSNEFLAALHASPAWDLYGLKGLRGATEFPPVDTPLLDGRVGYHVRSGEHDMIDYDWQRFIDFADRHLPALPLSRAPR